MGTNDLNAYEILVARAFRLLREWSRAHPFETDPTDAIETIAASCVPVEPLEIKAAAVCVGIDTIASDAEIPKKNGGEGWEALRIPLSELIEEELWLEWDAVVGEQELMNDFEDDLD